MGDVQVERRAVVEEIFKDYDFDSRGELSAIQLNLIHSDIRLGGISLPQVEESIKYVCVDDKCEMSELCDVLKEMDRRYYLIQDFRWEFSMMDRDQKDTITEEQARWFVQTVHGKYFSPRKWEKFIRRRAIPGSGVNFAEIEVMLCNIPSRDEFLLDLEEDKQENYENEKYEQEAMQKMEEEKKKLRKLKTEEKFKREIDEKKRIADEQRRHKEEEEERQKRKEEKDEADRLRKKLEEDEERGRREAEDRELQEATRLKNLQKQEEDRRKKEEAEAGEAEDILEDAMLKEKEAGSEVEKHMKRKENAKDDNTKKDAEESEQRARLKQKEFRNKKIRFGLKVAVKKRDRERLPPAVDDFKKAKLPDDDMDLQKADRVLKEFQARDGLRKAMASRQLASLEQAINFVKRNGFEMELSQELLEANKILLQLRRLERIRAEILELKQSTVAEIRSYQKPPPVVHTVMTGTFLLLGHKEKETADWKTVQALVGKTGKDGLKRRCLECTPQKVNQTAAKRAKTLLSAFDLDDVRDVSAGAATFYLWSYTMIEELENIIEMEKAEEEEKKREKAEKKKKLEEQKRREAELAAKAAAAAAAASENQVEEGELVSAV